MSQQIYNEQSFTLTARFKNYTSMYKSGIEKFSEVM